MPRRRAALSAIAVKQLKEPGLHAVGGSDGLYLSISKQSSRSWILRVMIGGKRRDMGLGSYPEVTLADARRDALAARERIRAGVDPIEERRARAEEAATDAARMTLAEAYERYLTTKKLAELTNEKHRKQWRSTFQAYVQPMLGDKPVDGKHPPRAVWLRGCEIVYRVSLWTHTKTPPAFKYYRSQIPAAVAVGRMTRKFGSLKKAMAMASRLPKSHAAMMFRARSFTIGATGANTGCLGLAHNFCACCR